MSALSSASRVVVVGAGHGGTRFAALLRQRRFTGEVVILEAEHDLPYERPPLSKRLLGGELVEELLPESFYTDNGIELHRGVRASSIDTESRVVHSPVRSVPYDRLVLATGATARRLDVPGADLAGVVSLRTLADARAINVGLRGAQRVAVVGGGWIGLEVAAAIRNADVPVVVVEQADRPLARVASRPLADFMSGVHRSRGTELVSSAKVTAFVEEHGALAGVELANGSRVSCDMAVVGIGAMPDIGLAERAGLACRDGVVVDDDGRTSHPDIYAIGDATLRPLPGEDIHLRLESIPSTLEQARRAVASILGESQPPAEVPWFWSDQFGMKIRLAGLRSQDDLSIVREGAADIAVFHVRENRLAAVETVNSPSSFQWARKLIRARTPIDLERLNDGKVPLQDTVAAAAG
jgi:3-phenylpropionate/trans-cinnamate dioxygenase ferredoxin reductase component